MRSTVIAILLAVSFSVSAFQPRTGHWNNLPGESGRGFNIDIQDGVMVLTVYAYDAAGNAQWYIASGNMTNGQRNFTGTLEKFVNGQCLTCNYTAAVAGGSDGTVSVTFTTETSATVTLPGGHVTTIHPFNFKLGDPPRGMLGEWVFVYDIGPITFAERFNYTTMLDGAPANTTGQFATDLPRRGGCEYLISGTLAGTTLCVQINASGALINSYFFKYGLDETFDGVWQSPSTGTLYPMKGFRLKGQRGFSKSVARSATAVGQKAALEDGMGPKASLEMLEAVSELAARIK